MTPGSKHRLQLKDGNRCPNSPFSHQQRADPLVDKGGLTAEKYTGNHLVCDLGKADELVSYLIVYNVILVI